MHRDEGYFLKKFAECGKHLAVTPSKIVSLKYREIRDYEYYKELLERLRNVDGLTVKDIGNALNGHAYLLSYGRQKIVLVEHETGLEILYIAGSIASLIGFVLQISSSIRAGRHQHFFPPHIEDVEIRRLDSSGKLTEEHIHGFLPPELFLLPQPDNAEIEQMKKRIAGLEKKLTKLTKKQPKKKK